MTDALNEAADYLCPSWTMSHRRRKALRCVLEKWPTFDRGAWKTREDARAAIYNQTYGSVLLILLLETVASAALSWVVEKLLDKWWGNGGMGADGDCAAKMDEWAMRI